jgi:2-succinyl-6-hydroxy-2,4-cyclohexadiene-1-carboxylate synthase
MTPYRKLATDQFGAGPRLVMVHGFTQTRSSWMHIARSLAANYTVVLVDAPGHGGSEGVRADLWTSAELLGEVGGRATYIGYSMGARICLHLALSRPELVERLVLLGATPGIDDPVERAGRRASDSRLAQRIETEGVEAFIDHWLDQPLFATLPPDPSDRERRLANTVSGLAASLRLAGTGTQDPLWNRLGEISIPVLLITGARDEKFSSIAERMSMQMNEDIQVRSIEEAGHAAHLEKPEQFLQILATWLGQADIS